MNNHVYVLILFPCDGPPKVEAVYTNRREAEKRKDAINKNYNAETMIEKHHCSMYPFAPEAAVIKRPLLGEDTKAMTIYKKLDKLNDELGTEIYNLKKCAENKRRSKRQQMIDQLLRF